jgi:hypothetical protein
MEDETESKYPEDQRGIRDGTSSQVTPLKHVNMYKRSFTKDNLDASVAYLKSGGNSAAPVFLTVDSRGEWSQTDGTLFWQANGSELKLQVLPQEELDDFLKKEWYRQDVPSGIVSFHNYCQRKFLGVSRADCKTFIQKQKPWQMLQPLRKKGKHRVSVLAKRPFSMIEIDIADMISFGQTDQRSHHRYVLVLVDNFSGFCMAEMQAEKEGPITLTNFQKMLAAIAKLGYKVPNVVKSDQGPEFSGPGWRKLDKQNKWKRVYTKNYPAVRAERKIRTLKTYVRLNSTLTRGDKTYWWNVLNSSVKAVNRIWQPKGGSPEDIIVMNMQERLAVKEKTSSLRQNRQQRREPTANEPAVGDSVRTRIPTEKLPMDYKGHLAYKRGVPIKWSDGLHRVERKSITTSTGQVRVFVQGRWRFWPSEILTVPANTVPSSVMGQDGNIDYEPDVRGARRSKRNAKRPARFADFGV